MGAKPYYRKQICFDEEFLKELEIFEKNIRQDYRFKPDGKKTDNLRFSKAIRELIKKYNLFIKKNGYPKEGEDESKKMDN